MFDSVKNGKNRVLIQLLLFSCVALLILLSDHNAPMLNYLSPYLRELINIICFGLAATASVIYIVIKKENRLLLSALAVRNLLLWIPAINIIIFTNLTVSYGFDTLVSWTSNSGRFNTIIYKFNYVIQPVGTYDTNAGILIYTSLVIFAYAAVKYKITKKNRGVS